MEKLPLLELLSPRDQGLSTHRIPKALLSSGGGGVCETSGYKIHPAAEMGAPL